MWRTTLVCESTLRVSTYFLCVKLHTVRKTTHFRIYVKLHTFCKTTIPERFLLRIQWKILHLTELFYTPSGCDGCDKYEVWSIPGYSNWFIQEQLVIFDAIASLETTQVSQSGIQEILELQEIDLKHICNFLSLNFKSS